MSFLSKRGKRLPQITSITVHKYISMQYEDDLSDLWVQKLLIYWKLTTSHSAWNVFGVQKYTIVTSSVWTATLCHAVFFHSQSATKTGWTQSFLKTHVWSVLALAVYCLENNIFFFSCRLKTQKQCWQTNLCFLSRTPHYSFSYPAWFIRLLISL